MDKRSTGKQPKPRLPGIEQILGLKGPEDPAPAVVHHTSAGAPDPSAFVPRSDEATPVLGLTLETPGKQISPASAAARLGRRTRSPRRKEHTSVYLTRTAVVNLMEIRAQMYRRGRKVTQSAIVEECIRLTMGRLDELEQALPTKDFSKDPESVE